MFKAFDEDHGYPGGDYQSHSNSRTTPPEALSRKEDTGSRKIFLPRGSVQAEFEPQPYYYFASNSGAVPSWVIDEITQRQQKSP